MSHIKNNSVWWSAGFFAVLCLWGITSHIATASDVAPEKITVESIDAQHQVAFQRNPDNACAQCHSNQENTLNGIHGDVINTKTNRDFTCIDCHTSITAAHRDGAADVIKFLHAQSAKGTNIPASHLDVIREQNQRCESCHQPAELREANWTHDVHARDLSCSSCHIVHPVNDPMKGISPKAKIATCVECHSNQYKAREQDK